MAAALEHVPTLVLAFTLRLQLGSLLYLMTPVQRLLEMEEEEFSKSWHFEVISSLYIFFL